MRHLLFTLILAALIVSGAPTASAISEGCFGVGVDPGYLAAFDTRAGQKNDGQVVYNDAGRFYRESQSWATPVGADPGHHSEHIHMAMCIPNGLTMTGPFPLDIAYTFHSMQDYRIDSASLSAVSPNGQSVALWIATPAQVAQLQVAADASGNGSVQRVFFSITTIAAKVNGWKEVRGGIATTESGPAAIFNTWKLDQRFYYIDNYPNLPAVTPVAPPSQNAIRNRPLITADGFDHSLYHHAGWCGFDGKYKWPSASTSDTDCYSARWKRSSINGVWSDTASKRVGLYVTDGGGDAYLMIDSDFHNHYDATGHSTTTANVCQNVDGNGNCLGSFVWRPNNARQELFSSGGSPHVTEATIPASAIAALAPGLHKLVFLSSDAPECERNNFPCPDGTRGEWSNVEVLPFRVQ